MILPILFIGFGLLLLHAAFECWREAKALHREIYHAG